MGEATTEEEAKGFIAQTVEPDRSRVIPPRKQDILKVCAPKNRSTNTCNKADRTERKSRQIPKIENKT